MGNGNLNCCATNCGHNNSGLCYAGFINISGHSAITSSNTCCSSFTNQTNDALTNCANCTCTKPEQISCDAVNCTYNENKSCVADNVQINASNASCETFIAR